MIVPYFLVFLFPLGAYLLFLAAINRRERPFLISGVWDAILLSLAISGILLWIGPALLGIFYERGLLPGSDEVANRRFAQIWTVYPWIWISYYALVIAGQALMIASRANKTVVYNVDAAALEKVIAQILTERGYRLWKADDVILLDKTEDVSRPSPEAGAVHIESFRALRNATIHWRVDAALKRTLDDEINARIDQAMTPDNPSVTYLLGVSGMIFGGVFLGAVFVILASMLPLRGF